MSRVCIVGVDGGEWSVIDKLNLKWIKRGKNSCVMKSTIPHFTPIAWNTLFTGALDHGIYGFVQLKENSYDYEIVDSTKRKVKALWNYKKGVYLNIPFSYPAEHIDGVIVPGLGSPDEDYGEAKYDLKSKRWINHALGIMKKEVKQAKRMWCKDWEVFSVVFRLTDLFQHNHWGDLHTIGKAYKKADDFVDWVMEHKREDDVVMIVSDHGFCGCDKVFCVNTWLKEKGYLYMPLDNAGRFTWLAELIKNSPLKGLALKLLNTSLFNGVIKKLPIAGFAVMNKIDERTKAFYIPGSCTSITINVKGKHPNGSVEPKDKQKVIDRLTKDLMKLEHIKAVYQVSNPLYDIVFELEEGWIFRSHDETNKVIHPIDTGVNGTHTRDGIYIGYGVGKVNSIDKVFKKVMEVIG